MYFIIKNRTICMEDRNNKFRNKKTSFTVTQENIKFGVNRDKKEDPHNCGETLLGWILEKIASFLVKKIENNKH